MTENLKEEILRHSVDGRLTCPDARGIAERLGISYPEVGSAADSLGIRIKGCELGCF